MASCVFWISYLFNHQEYHEPVRKLFISHGVIDAVAEEIAGGWLNDYSPWCVAVTLSETPGETFFELQLQAYFPGWDQFRPQAKFDLLFEHHFIWDAHRMRRLIRRQGPISSDDVRIWQEDGLSLLQWISTCFGAYIVWFRRYQYTSTFNDSPALLLEDWEQVMSETINSVDDLNQKHPASWFQSETWKDLGRVASQTPLEIKGSSTITPLVCILRGCQRFADYRIAEERVASFLSVLKKCGVDVRKFARREFCIWERDYGAIHKKEIQYVALRHWNWEFQTFRILTGIHYGSAKWSFDWDDCPNYAEEFRQTVEKQSSPLEDVMPGTWVDDSDVESD